MKKLVLLFAIFLLNATLGSAQFIKKSYFNNFRFLLLSEGGRLPVTTVQNGTDVSEKYFIFAGLVFDQRINLINFEDRASLSFSFPLSVKVMIAEGLLPADGGLDMGVGTYIDYNVGNNSTFNNIKRKGFTIGLGLDMDKIFSEEIPNLLFSPKIRLGINNEINYLNSKKVMAFIHLGIPRPFTNSDGDKVLANLNGSLSITFSY